tara:strand:+ start:11378 stop:12286 length:909 start_codon:yes stop_codon:yes gene_type:complete
LRIFTDIKTGLFSLCGLLVFFCLTGCSSSPDSVDPTPTITSDGKQYRGAVVLSTDLAVGRERLLFAVIDSDGRPTGKAGEVLETDLQLIDTSHIQKTQAVFREWPTGSAGVYSLNVEFDQPGQWSLNIWVPDSDSSQKQISTKIQVAQEGLSPAVGAPALATQNRTIHDVMTIAEISTDNDPDPDFYQLTIADAIISQKPSVILFGTPGYCQSQVCGPQISTLKKIKNKFPDQINYVHIELIDNPLDLKGDLARAIMNPVLNEWGLQSEPWTFVIDADGMIVSKYEGFVGEEEILETLSKLL